MSDNKALATEGFRPNTVADRGYVPKPQTGYKPPKAPETGQGSSPPPKN